MRALLSLAIASAVLLGRPPRQAAVRVASRDRGPPAVAETEKTTRGGAVAAWHATRKNRIAGELGAETIERLEAPTPIRTLSALTAANVLQVALATATPALGGAWWLAAAATAGAYRGRAEMVSNGPGFATCFERTVPAFRRCKSHRRRSSSRRARTGAGTARSPNSRYCTTSSTAAPTTSREPFRSGSASGNEYCATGHSRPFSGTGGRAEILRKSYCSRRHLHGISTPWPRRRRDPPPRKTSAK